MQFGGFSSDFERLARLDVTGQLDLPADARQRLQTEEAAIRHDMDRLWTAYMPSLSPGEEAERAAALQSAGGDFGAPDRRLEGLEQSGHHTGAAATTPGSFNAASAPFSANFPPHTRDRAHAG